MGDCDRRSCDTCPDRHGKSKDELLHCKLDRIKHKLIVMSGKGGVGKSSVAVYLAQALAHRGYRVGLMDVDLHGPSVPRILGIKGKLGVNSDEQVLPNTERPNLKVVSIESVLEEADTAVIWRGPLKHGVIRQFITDCFWGDLDFLVVDCPPGTGDEPLSVAQMMSDAGAIIVTTPQELALADVRKSINFCRKVGIRIVGLVENMSGLFCPHCSGYIPIFRSGGGEKTAEEMNVELLGHLPFDPAVVEGGDRGHTVFDEEKDTPYRQAVLDFADEVIKKLEGAESMARARGQSVH
jgi:Mrp family chromosome partitioning ATPase